MNILEYIYIYLNSHKKCEIHDLFLVESFHLLSLTMFTLNQYVPLKTFFLPGLKKNKECSFQCTYVM